MTAGLTHELVVVDPTTGRILRHVPLQSDNTKASHQNPSPLAFSNQTRKPKSATPACLFRRAALEFTTQTSAATSKSSVFSQITKSSLCFPLHCRQPAAGRNRRTRPIVVQDELTTRGRPAGESRFETPVPASQHLPRPRNRGAGWGAGCALKILSFGS